MFKIGSKGKRFLLFVLSVLMCTLAAFCDTMSVSESEQAKPVQGERRMSITGYACDAMSVSESEQAKPVQSERRMSITGYACDTMSVSESEQAKPVQGEREVMAQPAEETEMKKIAITFDDGPHPYYTEQLLDGLKERGVEATFFVTGEHAALHPDIIRRMDEEGHLIGNHTYSHMQLKPENREQFKKELVETNEVIKEITGQEVSYVRPPYGTWDRALEEELNMIPVLWTIDPQDWCSSNVSCITQNIVKKASENDIILMHDYYGTSVTAALKAIDALQEEGYTFVTVEEILFD